MVSRNQVLASNSVKYTFISIMFYIIIFMAELAQALTYRFDDRRFEPEVNPIFQFFFSLIRFTSIFV